MNKPRKSNKPSRSKGMEPVLGDCYACRAISDLQYDFVLLRLECRLRSECAKRAKALYKKLEPILK